MLISLNCHSLGVMYLAAPVCDPLVYWVAV
jgi:hypothetical protein